MIIIEEKSIGMAWQKAYEHVKQFGQEIKDDDQILLEITHLNLVIKEPDIMDPIMESNQGPMKEWMDNSFMQIKRVPELNDSWSYGWRLYNFEGKNQIDWVINKLQKKPETKSATISMLNPLESESYIPCVSLLDFKIRDNELWLTASCRSLDIGKKALHNFTNLARIAREVANSINILKTKLVVQIFSAHIYQHDLKE